LRVLGSRFSLCGKSQKGRKKENGTNRRRRRRKITGIEKIQNQSGGILIMRTETHTKKGVILAAVLSFALLLALTACSPDNGAGGTNNPGNGNNNSAGTNENTNDRQKIEVDASLVIPAGELSETSKNTDDAQTAGEGAGLVIPAGELSETAQFYSVTVDGTRMGVVAVKTPDGKIRTAFDTCQVCNGSPKAYFEQSGDTLQCQNCGNQFPMDRVEVEAGGCNPIPIFEKDKTVTDESVTISYETLEANKSLFPSNWRT
jgi:hypothetical protein